MAVDVEVFFSLQGDPVAIRIEQPDVFEELARDFGIALHVLAHLPGMGEQMLKCLALTRAEQNIV